MEQVALNIIETIEQHIGFEHYLNKFLSDKYLSDNPELLKRYEACDTDEDKMKIIDEEYDKLNINYKLVEQIGGEDQGSDYYFVLYYPKQNIHLKLGYYYSSYRGIEDYEDPIITKVSPKIKQILTYE